MKSEKEIEVILKKVEKDFKAVKKLYKKMVAYDDFDMNTVKEYAALEAQEFLLNQILER